MTHTPTSSMKNVQPRNHIVTLGVLNTKYTEWRGKWSTATSFVKPYTELLSKHGRNCKLRACLTETSRHNNKLYLRMIFEIGTNISF
ncbi:hypothetical protein D3C73_1452080 [compost metagenome]